MADCKDFLLSVVSNCDFWFATYAKPQNGSIFEREVKVLQLRGALEPRKKIDIPLMDALETLYADDYCDFATPSQKYYQLQAFEAPKLWSKDWREILTAGVNNGDVRKSFELERARLALGSALWMILLWETDWFTHICSCSFRNVILPKRQILDGPVSQAKTRQENVYFAAKGFSDDPVVDNEAPTANVGGHPQSDDGAQPENQTCSRRSARSDKLLLFGILLAELVLGEPIDLDEQNQIKGRFPNLPRLQRELRESVPGAFGAVKTCFDNATDERWIEAGSILSVGQLETLIDDVLKPIHTHYKVVKDNTLYESRTFDINEHKDDNLSFHDAQG